MSQPGIYLLLAEVQVEILGGLRGVYTRAMEDLGSF